MPISIVDLYFYEELCRVAGHETGSRWLLALHTKQRRLKRSTSGTSCFSSTCRPPDRTYQSAPASPRIQPSCLDGKVSARCHGRPLSAGINLCNGSFSANIRSSTDPFGAESNFLEIALKNPAPSQISPPLLLPDSPKMGLIFTDAAHSVLD
jgi:hypothetical protein